MIPKTIHIIWIGDPSRAPSECINSWISKNSSYEIKIWGNDELNSLNWHNKHHIDKLLSCGFYNGAADLMRYEILYNFGGVYVDADSICLNGLEDWLLHTDDFVSWENEHIMPGLLGNGVIGAKRNSNFLKTVILDAALKSDVCDQHPWLTVGPKLITDVWKKNQFRLTIYPSHFFYPNHRSGFKYDGTGQVFCDQLWASTLL